MVFLAVSTFNTDYVLVKDNNFVNCNNKLNT